MSLTKTKGFIRELFLEGIGGVRPDKLIGKVLRLDKDDVMVDSRRYDLSKGKCYIIGCGKAVTEMAFRAEQILKDKLYKGVLSVPQGMDVKQVGGSKLKIFKGALNNLPDENSVKATREIISLAREASENDLVLIMISGGGSALLSQPKRNMTLSEKTCLIQSLAKSGAQIKELNCVRKRISDIKGGKLSKFIYPARSVSFILSDIVGDPIDLIASGPTVKNDELHSKALDILKKYNLYDSNHNIVKSIIDDPDLDDAIFENTENIILANNRVALEAMERAAKENYATVVLSSTIEANVKTLGRNYARLATSSLNSKNNPSGDAMAGVDAVLTELGVGEEVKTQVTNILSSDSKKICFLLGGETVVNVRGTGSGGRNLELALTFSTELERLNYDNLFSDCNVMFLSGGTDGIDGPTDAAGALTYPGQPATAREQGIDPHFHLDNNDSYNYFNLLHSSQDLLKIGHTGVNVMDLHILLIHR